MNPYPSTLTPSPAVAEDLRALNVDALYQPLRPLRRIGGQQGVEILLDDQTYDPKTNPLLDWVHRVALPGFQSLNRRLPVRDFCTVGTGTGTDALAAIEVFDPRLVALTDVEAATVDLAARNVARNLRPGQAVEIRCGVGDLLAPFSDAAGRFDLIYENLPNIPLTPIEQRRLLKGRNRATYHSQREEVVPTAVRENLLELHWLCLHQARPLLNAGGTVLSSIGARRPIAEILGAMASEGFEQRLEIFTWKIQSEPEEVIGGFAAHEQLHRGFHFYPVEAVEKAFEGLTSWSAATYAFELEAALEAEKLSAFEALERSRAGEAIAHTVLALSSQVADDTEARR